LGVHDILAIGRQVPHGFLRAESLLVKVNRLGGILHYEMRRDGVESVWN
jgi:hypothetical protein